MNVKLLRSVFPCALGVMDNDLFHHLIKDQWRKLLYVRIFSDKSQKAGSVHSAFLILVDLRPQSGDFLFQDKLLVVIPLREHHKPLVGQLAADVILVGF